MSQITVSNLTFSYNYSSENIFENVSFIIDTDWKLGVIGRNGKGKTTLLELLLGIHEFKGKITKNINFKYFPFEIKDKNKIVIDILKELNSNLEEWKIEKELNLLNTDLNLLNKNFNILSGGEQVKILLASLFVQDNQFLLIDEPTNHLDKQSIETIKQYLKTKKGYILVSHDRNLIDETCNHILSINNTNIEIQKGNYSTWKGNKENQNKYELSQNELLKRNISNLREASKRTKIWADKIESSKTGKKEKTDTSSIDKGYIGHQSAKMMKRSKSFENRLEKSIQEKENLLRNIDRVDSLILKPINYFKNNLIFAKDLSISYDNTILFHNIDFELNIGDRVSISGKNGVGKSSVLNLILKKEIKYTGQLNIGQDIKISYIPQDTSELKGNLNNYIALYNLDETIFKTNLIKLGLTKQEFEKDLYNLSEGQKKKILIARSLTQEANLYIWDEPLNYIDIISREQIEEAILKYNPTMIFVEHDGTFLNKIATKKIEIKKCVD